VDRVTNIGLDANYQFIVDPTKAASDMISMNSTWIRQTGRMDASAALNGALPNHSLETFRANLSYSFAATFTPTVQYFQTRGTQDPNYWDTRRGSPNSSGMIYELAFVPFGKVDSPFQRFNARFAVQYIDYFRFDGSQRAARRNDTLYVSLTSALKF
jgi:hypothetical protein